MSDQEHCKTQMHVCCKLWQLADEKQDERIKGIEKALAVNDKEIERRMHQLNALREEFTRKEGKFVVMNDFNDLKTRVSNLEQRAVVWVGVMTVIFVALQFIFRMWKP